MNQFKYDEWIENKIDELMNLQVKVEKGYNGELIRDYLIFLQSSKGGYRLKEFFVNNNQDGKLLKAIIDILLDESEDYSNDARYSAAKVISIFNIGILKKYKKEIIQAQNSNIINLRPYNSDEIPDWLIE